MDTLLGPLPAGQPRDALLAEVHARLGHLPRDVAVVIACSGGPDSTALAFLVAEARADLRMTLAHVRHGLRDDTEDRALVHQHAAWLGCDVADLDVEVTRDGHGTEAAARASRYAALRERARVARAAAILIGHSADDQAETLLLRIARGTGVAGLAGMASVRGDLTRPLLRIRRDDLRRFVALEGLPVVLDESNTDDAIRRVRVRTHVLPALQRIGPDTVAALGRLAELARDDDAALERAAADAGALRWVGPVAVLDRERLAALDAALARRVVRAAITAILGTAPRAAVVELVRAAVPGTRATLPGGIGFDATRAWCTLVAGAGAGDGGRAVDGTRASVLPAVDVALPGVTPWPAAGVAVRGRTAADAADDPFAARLDQPAFDQIAFELTTADGRSSVAPWCPPPHRPDPAATPPGGSQDRLRLLVADTGSTPRLRHVAPGDRIGTAAGTRRVAAVLRDAGVPRVVRERWPVVVVDDRVVWVPGLVVDAAFAAAGKRSACAVLDLVRDHARA